MLKEFDLQCAPGKTAHVLQQEKSGRLVPGVALVLFPEREGETDNSPAAFLAPLHRAHS
jgi:hypothetical protein